MYFNPNFPINCRNFTFETHTTLDPQNSHAETAHVHTSAGDPSFSDRKAAPAGTPEYTPAQPLFRACA